MAFRFKASKYKNAAPKHPKKETWIHDISVGSPQCYGDLIAASAEWMAFNVEPGGNLRVLPVGAAGRKGRVPLLRAHSDQISDLEFSPFDDALLATAAFDGTVRLWVLPTDSGQDDQDLSLSPACSLSSDERRFDLLTFNPLANNILATSSNSLVHVWNLTHQTPSLSVADHPDQIFDLKWDLAGSELVTTCKDKKLRVIDIRQQTVAMEASSHQNIKDSKVAWLTGDRLLTTGFDRMRQRQVFVWDRRALAAPVSTLELDTSAGVLVPLYDPDTQMCILNGKAESKFGYFEITAKHPYLMEASTFVSEVQSKSVCLVPKRALDVMECEVNRVLQLSQHAIVPVRYYVPRKSYRDFHEDLFPETAWDEEALTSSQWLAGLGESLEVQKQSLDPSKRPAAAASQAKTRYLTGADQPDIDLAGPTPDPSLLSSQSDTPLMTDSPAPEHSSTPLAGAALNGHSDNNNMSNGKDAGGEPDSKPEVARKPPVLKDKPVLTDVNTPARTDVNLRRKDAPAGDVTGPRSKENTKSIAGFKQHFETKAANQAPPPVSSNRSSKINSFIRTSKCRHMKGTAGHRSSHIENLRKLSQTVPLESNGFAVNPRRVAVPVGGPGGNLSVLELDKTGRLPDVNLPWLNNGATVTDFSWDPFDDCRLAVGCDDGCVRVWRVPDGGLDETLTEPELCLEAYQGKVVLITWHPTASDLLTVASVDDNACDVWDLAARTKALQLLGHSQPVLACAWDSEGARCATVCRDGRIRGFDPRSGPQPLQEGDGPENSRAARLVWVCDDQYIAVTGFNRTSVRMLLLYSATDLTQLTSLDLEVSPAILVPHYDPDTSTIFLTSKGDSTVFGFEVAPDSPHFFPLAPHKGSGLHQSVAFLPKNTCDVRKVEFARALRLTKTHIEPLSFTVPRVKITYFQDDVFPATRVTWAASLSGADWLAGSPVSVDRVSLKPDDMDNVSGSSQAPRPGAGNPRTKMAAPTATPAKSTTEKKQDLVSAVQDAVLVHRTDSEDTAADSKDDAEWE